MSTLYGEPLLFKSKYVCNRSGSIQAPSSTTKVEDGVISNNNSQFLKRMLADVSCHCKNDVSHGVRRCNVVLTLERR